MKQVVSVVGCEELQRFVKFYIKQFHSECASDADVWDEKEIFFIVAAIDIINLDCEAAGEERGRGVGGTQGQDDQVLNRQIELRKLMCHLKNSASPCESIFTIFYPCNSS